MADRSRRSQVRSVRGDGKIVQKNAMKVWESDGALSLLELLKADRDVTAALSPAEIEARFDLDYHLKHVDTIFARVFGD